MRWRRPEGRPHSRQQESREPWRFVQARSFDEWFFLNSSSHFRTRYVREASAADVWAKFCDRRLPSDII